MDEIRSFIAIEVPQALKARMEELQKELQRTDADVRWVRPEGIHLTLKFIGSIRQEDVDRITQAVGPMISAWEPFDVRIQGMGCFPSGRNPRVIWIGLDHGKGNIQSLQQAIEKKTAELSFPSENRPFSPHLTLGRVRSPRGKAALSQAVEAHKEVDLGTFRAREVFLFRSELKPSGAVYTKLQNFEMKQN